MAVRSLPSCSGQYTSVLVLILSSKKLILTSHDQLGTFSALVTEAIVTSIDSEPFHEGANLVNDLDWNVFYFGQKLPCDQQHANQNIF